MNPATRLIPAAAVALALAAAPAASAATSATDTSTVTADIVNTLEATFPADYAWGESLSPGANTSSEQNTTVKSNATWGVKISSDLADGRMKEALAGTYVALTPKVLASPLEWRLSTLGGAAQGSTTFAALSSTEALITGTRPATSDSGTGVGVTYRQPVSYSDVNAGLSDYKIVVNYSVAQGF